tara:strand:- start:155 stop:484 length:330 start_codon:yes stop_codon:yes gene_type:complete
MKAIADAKETQNDKVNVTVVRHTLSIIQAAVPIDKGDMFPYYHDAATLCNHMEQSLSAWEDKEFVADAIAAFNNHDAEGCRKGMELAMEKVYYYLPTECKWDYIECSEC